MPSTPGTAIERAKRFEIVRPPLPSEDEINRSWRLAKVMATARVFPDVDDAAKAFAVMLIGHDLGLTPSQALQGVHLVKGRPMVGYTLLGSFVKRIPGYDYKVLRRDEQEARLSWYIDGKKVGESHFSMEDAQRAGLVDANGKAAPKRSEGWNTYPRNMLFARAMSEGVRVFMPDATGGVPVYTEGEIEPEPNLTAALGDGNPLGIVLPKSVEDVLAKAAEVGHPGYDRATVEMSVGSLGPNEQDAWAAEQMAELHAYADAHPISEAEVVEPIGTGDPEAEAAARIATAEQLERDSKAAEAEGRPEEAQTLYEGAKEMREQAAALGGRAES